MFKAPGEEGDETIKDAETEEKRLDPSDGLPYTKASFIEVGDTPTGWLRNHENRSKTSISDDWYTFHRTAYVRSNRP